MMKIAVVTVNIGEIDDVRPIPSQSVGYDYFCFTDSNLPFPMSGLDNRMKSKYLKTQLHRILPDYDMYIYLDGRVEVVSEGFVKEFADAIEQEAEIVCCAHNDRDNVYEEIEYIVNAIEDGKEYLKVRYGHQDLQSEADFFRRENVPNDCRLLRATVFGIGNNYHTNKVMDEWWAKCCQFTNFDQAMFSYIVWLHFNGKKSVKLIEADNEFFQYNKHIKIA